MSPADRLSPRQREALLLKAEGLTYGEAAHRMGVSEQTVKNHLGQVYIRLGAGHMIEALRIIGWLRLPSDEVTA